MSPDIAAGFVAATLPGSLLATAIGAVLGLIVGMIPGVTISTGIIMVLPLTFALDPAISIALLLGIYAGGMTGGSFSAVLLNIPGTPSASATVLDGYPMARKGEAGRAISVSIVASFAGGFFSFLCLYFIAPSLADLALRFQAPDLFSVVFFGLTVICTFAARSPVKGLLSAVIGLAIVTIGQDPVMGTARFTFGDADMLSGIHFLSALIGLFAIPQLVDNMIDLARGSVEQRSRNRMGSLFLGWADLKAMRMPVAIGSVIGAFMGILPGVGGPIAAFIGYDYAKRWSRDKERFGKGCVEGVAAPEAANNAVTGGALIPMMTLGIPGDPITAIMIGALLVHGLAPGPLLFIQRGDFAYTMIFSFMWANILTLALSLAGVRLLVKVLAAPKALLMPSIAILCVIGSYALRNSFFDVWVMVGFGVLGIAMRYVDMTVVPMLLAMVLGEQLEEYLRLSLTASKGDPSVFFTSPFSLAFLVLSVVSIVWAFASERRGGGARSAPAG
jgi:putative tricarboxylic transport membrane protein